MTRLHLTLLLLLSAIGWSCAFAIVGIAVFRGAPDFSLPAAIFAAFGAAAGVVLAVLRLGPVLRPARNVRARRSGAGAWPTEAGAFAGSVFGA